MKNKIILFAFSFTLLLAGCYERPYHEYGYAAPSGYVYDYYPDTEVYFATSRHLYYWHEGNDWRSGRAAPPRFELHSHVRLNLASPEPYRHHEDVRKQYPRRRPEQRGR
jgi:hypothetical protein